MKRGLILLSILLVLSASILTYAFTLNGTNNQLTDTFLTQGSGTSTGATSRVEASLGREVTGSAAGAGIRLTYGESGPAQISVASSSFGGTNLSEVDIFNILNLVLEASDGRISFRAATNLFNGADLNANVFIGDKIISINTGNIPGLNAPATLVFSNIDCKAIIEVFTSGGFSTASSEVILNGELCASCSSSCVGTELSVDVPGFSSYAVKETPIALANRGYSPICRPDWQCTEWSACGITGTQSRACADINSCRTSYGKPNETQSCIYSPTCNDNIKNQDETDIDCGGVCGSSCETGAQCETDSDCQTDFCESEICAVKKLIEAPAEIVPKEEIKKPISADILDITIIFLVALIAIAAIAFAGIKAKSHISVNEPKSFF